MLLKLIYLIRPRNAIFLSVLMLAFCASSCKWFQKKNLPTFKEAAQKDSLNGWVSLNILFPANTNASQRNARLLAIENEIRRELNDTLAARGIEGEPTFKVDSCICDSLLYLLNADIKLWGTTGSNTKPPEIPKDPGASGGPGELVDNNDAMSLPTQGEFTVGDTSNKEIRPSSGKPAPLRLAILDTGIDPGYFQNGFIRHLLWDDPSRTFSNFLVGAPDPRNNFDDNKGKHGTSVTALVLRQFRETLPSLMILKVLDKDGKGSVFTVSCALSYTAQNKAKLVNISLGYFGKSDAILSHYIQKNMGEGNFVIAAAGNVRDAHTGSLCRNFLNNQGLLDDRNLFFPACFANLSSTQRLISVTGINGLSTACHYQNYSPQFVTMGVMNRPENCCFYNLNFVHRIEGSSFATPIVTGKIGNYFLSPGGGNEDLTAIFTALGVQTGAENLTIGGKFVKE